MKYYKTFRKECKAMEYNHRTEGMSELETMVNKNNIVYRERWSPICVSCFENPLKEGNIGLSSAEAKNIAYSLQYLQFVQLELNELHLHNIVEQQLWKTYIITAMAIIECIFNSIVKKNGKQLINEWSEGIELDTNEIVQNNITKKCKVIMYEKLQTPIDVEMKFFQLIDIVEKKRLISFRTKGYEDLRTLKNIRNRIHLSASEMNDTDYYKIEKGHYLLSRRYLYFVITNEKLYSSPQTSFDFIKLSEKENKEADAYLKKMEEN